MEEVNATQAARQLSDLLNRVADQGASFEFTRAGRRIARLVPAGPPRSIRVSELTAIFAHISTLDEDANAFLGDIADAHSAIVAHKDPWAE